MAVSQFSEALLDKNISLCELFIQAMIFKTWQDTASEAQEQWWAWSQETPPLESDHDAFRLSTEHSHCQYGSQIMKNRQVNELIKNHELTQIPITKGYEYPAKYCSVS
jgi:hypothetical protein